MKKSILLSLSMLVLATGGIVFGTDCSIYQGQIELYEDRIREYQDAAAGYSASIASQMSAAGLSYGAIGSATSSNPYSSKITELQGKLIQAKADYTNCVYSNQLNDISNEINSLGSYSSRTTKSGGDKACKESFGNYAEVSSNDYSKCVCKDGYTWNSAGTSCIKYTKDIADKECRNEFGSNSEARSDDYSKCVCKDGYIRNANQSACIKYTKEKADSDCKSQYGLYSEAESDDYYRCTCTEGYIFNENKTKCVVDETYWQIVEMLAQDKKCQDMYGEHSIFADKCVCVDGYVRNNDGTVCIQQQSTITSYNNNTDTYNNGFSQEYNNAYQFAFSNKITTMPTIEEANMNGEIIRAEIAKMLANWVKSLGYTPDTSKSCKFKDISSVKGDLYTAIIESCQLGIMGQGISNFRPYDKITRGEVSTAISRILWGNQYEGGNPYYTNHMEILKVAGILDDINTPGVNELRGNVMVMLMRVGRTS